MSWLTRLSTWLTARIGSFGTEICAGVLLSSATQILPIAGWWRLTIALGVSLAYEELLDRNGWSWSDYRQRAIGILGAALLWWLVR